MIQKTTNNLPSVTGGDDNDGGSNSTLESNSIVHVDMKTLSQSELYYLSRSSSSVFHPKNDVIPNINSDDHRSTAPITITTAKRIFAFSHRRGPHSRISSSENDTQATENRLILNSLNRLVAEGDVVVNQFTKVKRRKRKRKLKNEDEFEGLGLIDVNGEMIDLKFLACGGDYAFESELRRMTEEMVTEDEFLGFLNGLEGRWGSNRKRRKYVDAIVLLKALPVNWKILLSLRPRARRPSLYCRRFVSPSDQHFNSCKDVAFYLKSRFVTCHAKSHEEGAMMQMETGCQTDLESGGRVPGSSLPASKLDILGTDKLHEVKCDICRESFASIVGLESHQQTCNGNNIQRLDMDTLTRKRSVPSDLLLVRETNIQQKTAVDKDIQTGCNELKNLFVNGEGSNEPEDNSEAKENLKTRCIWCLVEFFREPVDADTLASSCGFICPKCKEDVSWRFESALTQLTQLVDN